MRLGNATRVALCLALLAFTAMAQYRGGIQGVVTDPTGGWVPDATITLTSKETSIKRSTKTNETGGYALPGLPPGTYSLSVEKAGFTKKVLDEVVITGDQSQSLNVGLAVGQVTESVNVTEASVPLLNTESAVI